MARTGCRGRVGDVAVFPANIVLASTVEGERVKRDDLLFNYLIIYRFGHRKFYAF